MYNVDEATAQTIRALVVSDGRLYREGLVQMLCEAPGVHVVGSVSAAAEALDQVHALSPDVVLLDMAMCDALALARQIARESKITKVVALGMPELEVDVLSGAAAGIAGYITRNGSMSDVLEAIRAAALGEVHCSPKIAGYLFRHIATLSSERGGVAPASGLTARETEILQLVRQGMSNKMISRSLGIELPTVKNHVHSILAKLGVHRRAEAILLFRDGPNS
jgi:DNA-binding NarL/FixJ family response regulator